MIAHAQAVLDALRDAGLTVTPLPNGKLNVAPSSRLTPELREMVRSGKADMLRWFEMNAANHAPDPPDNPLDWKELAAAYHAHHFNCPTCIAAGRGARYGLRCGFGASLWRAYSE